MSQLLRGEPWRDVAAALRRLARPPGAASALADLADRIAGSRYAAGLYGAVSSGSDHAPVLHLAQTPAFDPERGSVSAAGAPGAAGGLVLRYHRAPGDAATIDGDGAAPFDALERFLLERGWFRRPDAKS